MEQTYCSSFISLQGDIHKLCLHIFAFFDPPPPWLTDLYHQSFQIYLLSLTCHEPHSPIAINIVCAWPQSRLESSNIIRKLVKITNNYWNFIVHLPLTTTFTIQRSIFEIEVTAFFQVHTNSIHFSLNLLLRNISNMQSFIINHRQKI